jgi:AsnC-like helix-turn-helix protein
MLVRANPKGLPGMLSALKRLDDIYEIYDVTGQYYSILKIRTASTDDLSRIIDEIGTIEGVAGTETVIVLRTVKEETAHQGLIYKSDVQIAYELAENAGFDNGLIVIAFVKCDAARSLAELSFRQVCGSDTSRAPCTSSPSYRYDSQQLVRLALQSPCLAS